jgi:release factor glutamine methyltransferase
VGQLFRDEKALSRLELMAIICHVLNVTTERLLMSPDRELDSIQWQQIGELIQERIHGKPVAYLTHYKEFFSHNFYVDERVLIPRPETELIVEEALHFLSGQKKEIRILDMGTGSGIIGLSIAKAGAGHVFCIDISLGAIEVAHKNATLLGVGNRVVFHAGNLFSSLRASVSFDLICANLPYVTTDEYNVLMNDVKEYEPKEALIGGTDGMDLYRQFAAQLKPHLAPGGIVLSEIGSEVQAEMLSRLYQQQGLQAEIKRDLEGRQRMVKGIWTSLS